MLNYYFIKFERVKPVLREFRLISFYLFLKITTKIIIEYFNRINKQRAGQNNDTNFCTFLINKMRQDETR